jgi:septal ring-binding cell division protein DamX
MHIHHRKQCQFELFPGSSGNNNDGRKPRYQLKDLTLSPENLIVLCILLVMSLVIFYSFGIERGKEVVNLSNVEDEKAIDLNKDAVEQPTEAQISSSKENAIPSTNIEQKVIEEKYQIIESPIENQEKLEDIFTIQVASFKLEKNAQKEAERLKKIGYDIHVVTKGNYSIVCVGKFAKRTEAKKFSNKLKYRYNDCLIRRL